MRKLISALVLSGLISTGLLASSYGQAALPEVALSIDDVLMAHNVSRDAQTLSAYLSEAVKLTSYYVGSGGESHRFFERKVSVSISGKAFRRYKADPAGVRRQLDLFDGQVAHHTVDEDEKKVEVNRMTDRDLRAAEFGINTFGLIPVLRCLADPATKAVYAGRAEGGGDRFEVRTATGNWTLYTDDRHVIRGVEIGDKSIEYADYRLVDGIRLPFNQRLSLAGRLVYELVFTRIALNPAFPADHFSSEALARQTAH